MKKHYKLSMAFFCVFCLAINTESGGKLSPNQGSMDVKHYDLNLKVDPNKEIILGEVEITFELLQNTPALEFDLIKKFSVSGASVNGMNLAFDHNGDKVYVDNPGFTLFVEHKIKIKYGGKPPIAKTPPWSGGFTWSKSEDGNNWVGVTCQSNGAHIWYPCKEHPSDKANGADIRITVPDPLMVVSNGLLKSTKKQKNRWTTWHWSTSYPISTYNINFTIGSFEVFDRTGYVLDSPIKMELYVLPEKADGGLKLLEEAEEYLNFYASYFGQYPWIEEKFGICQVEFS